MSTSPEERADTAGELLILLLQEPLIRQHVLAQPNLCAALTLHAHTTSTLECSVVQQQLASYLDAELLGTATHTIYRSLAQHLRHCPLCLELYCTSCSISAAQRTGLLPGWPRLSS